MTETAERLGSGAGQEQSTSEQAKEKVQETAQQVQQKAQEVKGQAGDRVRQELDSRSTQAGSQLQLTADAMRRTGQQLRDEEKEGPAKAIDMVADRAEQLGNYMTSANADKILRDVEDFARRQPWLVAFAGATLGFLASRFTKASSTRRYEGSGGETQNGQRAPSPVMTQRPDPAAAEPASPSHALGVGTPMPADDELAHALDPSLKPGATSSTPSSPAGTGKGGQSRKRGEPRGS